MLSSSTDKVNINYMEEQEKRWDLFKDFRNLFYPISSILVSLELLSLITYTNRYRGISILLEAMVYVSYILVVGNLLSLCFFLANHSICKGILSRNQERKFCILCIASYSVAIIYGIISSFTFHTAGIYFIDFSLCTPLFISFFGLPHLITIFSVFFSGISIISFRESVKNPLNIIVIIVIYFGLNLYAAACEFFLIKQRHSTGSIDKTFSSEVSIGVHYSTKVLAEIIRSIRDGYESYSKVLLENECITEKEWSEDSTMATIYIGRKICSSMYAMSEHTTIRNNDDLSFMLRPSQFTFSSILHNAFRMFECEQGSSLQLYFDDNCPEIFLNTSFEIFEDFIYLLLFAIIHQMNERSVIINISTAQEKSSYRVNIICTELERKSDISLKQSLRKIIPSSMSLKSAIKSDDLYEKNITELAYHLAARYFNLKVESSYHEQKLGLESKLSSFFIPKDIVSIIDNTPSFMYSQLKIRHRWLIITSYNDSENKNNEWHSTLTPILDAMNIPSIFCDIKHLSKTIEKYLVAFIHESILKKYPFQFSSTIQNSALDVIVVDDTSHSTYEINNLYAIEPLTVLPSHITVDSVTKCLTLIGASQSPREQNGKITSSDSNSLPLDNLYQMSRNFQAIQRRRLSSSSQKKKLSFLKLNDVFLPRLLDLVLKFEKLQIIQLNYSKKATVEAILDGIKIRLNDFERGEMKVHVDDALFSQTNYEKKYLDLLISESDSKKSNNVQKFIDNKNTLQINKDDKDGEYLVSSDMSTMVSSEVNFPDDFSNDGEMKTYDKSGVEDTKVRNRQINDTFQGDDHFKGTKENSTVVPKILEMLDTRHKKAKFICSEFNPVIESLHLHLQNKSFNNIEKLASMACLRSAKYSISRLSIYFATLQDFINILFLFCDNRGNEIDVYGQIFDDEVVDFLFSTFDVIEAVILDVVVYDN